MTGLAIARIVMLTLATDVSGAKKSGSDNPCRIRTQGRNGPRKHMQAIITKYHGPSKTRGYILAKSSGCSVRSGYDDSLNLPDNHRAAAKALIVKLHWHKSYNGGLWPVWYSGGLDSGAMVHVCAWESEALDCSDAPARPYVVPAGNP